MAKARGKSGLDLPAKRDDLFSFLDKGLVDPLKLSRIRLQVAEQGGSVLSPLLSQGLISPKQLVREMAAHLGLECLCETADLKGFEPDDSGKAAESLLAGGEPLRASGLVMLVRARQSFVALDPLYYDESILPLVLQGAARDKGRLLLITPALRKKLLEPEITQNRLQMAIHGLGQSHRGFSAFECTSPGQKRLLGFLFALLAAGLALSPITTIYVLGGTLNLLFFCAILLRLVAAIRVGTYGHAQKAPGLLASSELPVYTILVPLFHEHRVVGSLIKHLLAMDYPRDKLDIKLIFEQEDHETLAAARSVMPPELMQAGIFEFVIVPKRAPQTKPKALNYAMASARGRYVVVYDAEDRPEADQLKKAVAVFEQAARKADETLICLQASLNHYNIDENWLARQFTIEYTVQFDGFMPLLQELDLPLMLGGTSNHFRIDILRQIGGWDAFNVTEDADLGIRLYRFGYRSQMLASTTYEEACCQPKDWLRQRTRWLKGWLQTYLVHMRHPLEIFRQLGARGFAGMQIILGAQVLSLIAHPLFIVFMVYEAAQGHIFTPSSGWFGHMFWLLALANFTLGYSVSIWLGFVTLKRRKLNSLLSQLPFMPLYWLLISFATFRAILHYVQNPFYWEKTEHGQNQNGQKEGQGQAGSKPGDAD